MPAASRSGPWSKRARMRSRRRRERTPTRGGGGRPPRGAEFLPRHTGVGSDGILLVRETEERGFVAEIVIYNPDGSEAELSGNGVRQAVLYLRRNGWVDTDSFSGGTAAGEIRPRIDGALCTMDMGRAR